MQIDHVVALGWAWHHHGAWSWRDDQRLLFANDPANLVAATDDTNQSKSDAGLGEWLPPAAELRCGYVEQFVGVLGAYGLAIGAEDREAAEVVLASCQRPPPPRDERAVDWSKDDSWSTCCATRSQLCRHQEGPPTRATYRGRFGRGASAFAAGPTLKT